jgi:7-cyano-7-deazaguanine synthase
VNITHAERNKPDSVAVFSGGMDSTTLVYEMLQQGLTPHLLSFDYGQRHGKELLFAEQTAHDLGLKWNIVDLTGLTYLISNSALTSPQVELTDQVVYVGEEKRPVPIEVPEGHYAEDTMKATVVPNRNMIMLSIAAGVMVNNSYKYIGMGVHGGDHFVYPDCRPEFFQMANAAVFFGNEGFGAIPKRETLTEHAVPGFLYLPFLNKSKADIAYTAFSLQVPLENTWSCYKGGEKHCGKCGTCVERLEAIDEACRKNNWGIEESDPSRWSDKTEYEDTEFWRGAIKRG